ncbi:hypothetical protein HGG75_24045 [Ochrobactrum pseudogrignonense]|nr:hypothetical protein [Brucella pseudogrignonensis]
MRVCGSRDRLNHGRRGAISRLCRGAGTGETLSSLALFDYIDRGTEAETALQALHHGFATRRIVPRVLRSVSAPDVSVQYLGATHKCPL